MATPAKTGTSFKLNLSPSERERAEALQNESLIIDALSGHIVAPEPPPVDGKAYLTRLLEANIHVVSITIAAHSDGFDEALIQMFEYYNLLQVEPDRTVHIKTVADIERAHREKKVGILFNLQTPTPIDNHFYRWTIFHKLGLRISQITYHERNIFADGCYEPGNQGLSYYGIQAVQEMNRLGIVVDLSHAGVQTMMDTINRSANPCIFSHSNARAVTPVLRNAPDEAIKLLASKGGVIGLTPHGNMSHKELGTQPTLSDYLDHFEYIAKLVGIDHLGVGTDVFESYSKFSWESSTKLMYNYPWFYETVFNEGFKKITDISNLIGGLVQRGFSDDDIRKILGENFMRVFKEVWRDDL